MITTEDGNERLLADKDRLPGLFVIMCSMFWKEVVDDGFFRRVFDESHVEVSGSNENGKDWEMRYRNAK